MDAPHATWRIHTVTETDPYSAFYRAERVRLHGALIEAFRAENLAVETGEMQAIVTAGPPAAGKSTLLNEAGYDERWRRIDADYFKLRLIEHDRAHGMLPEVAGLPTSLADGKGVMPMELSSLYHRESAVLADKARQICLEAHENVVIEGTLAWDGLVSELVGDFTAQGYEQLEVLVVEPPIEAVLERSLSRWWADRSSVSGVSGLGGRFTPAAAIRGLYRGPRQTMCAVNAEKLVRIAREHRLRAQLRRA